MRGQGANAKHNEVDGAGAETSSAGVQADENDLDLLHYMAITPDEVNTTLPKHVSMENLHNNQHMSGAPIEFCPQTHIPAPSERVTDQPQYELLKNVSADEGSALATRVGDSNQPTLFPINDINWRFDGDLLPGTIS